ncbi:MAG: VWA-like domain-containing protein [Thermofilaceae archaeon]
MSALRLRRPEEGREREAEGVVRDIRRTRFRILERFPPFFSVVSDKDVYVTRDIPTAAVSSRGDLLVNPDFWGSLSPSDKLVVLLHEALHSELYHHERLHAGSELERFLWNIATDAFINSILAKMFPGSDVLRDGVMPSTVYELIALINPSEASRYRPEDFERMSEEEIYRALLKALTKLPKNARQKAVEQLRSHARRTLEKGESKDPKEVEGVDEAVVGKGEKEEGKPREEKERERVNRRLRVKQVVREALKTAGVSPGDIEEVVDKLAPRGSVNWRNYLVSTVNRMLTGGVVSTYTRPNRRFEALPGYKRYITPSVKAMFLVDVSGSIDSDTLRRFLEEVLWAKSVLGNRLDGYLVTWDVGVRDVMRLADLRPGEAVTVSGRGGTVVDDALRKALEVAEREGLDLVVLMTDGFVHLEDKTLPSKLLTKVKHGIVLYTDIEPGGFDGWELARYQAQP